VKFNFGVNIMHTPLIIFVDTDTVYNWRTHFENGGWYAFSLHIPNSLLSVYLVGTVHLCYYFFNWSI
jgi:hypothetical protein